MTGRLYDHTVDVLWYAATTPLKVGERFYFVYVLTFIALAYVSYRTYYQDENPAFFRFAFPKRIYLHPSARTDYAIYFINLFFSPLVTFVGVGLQTAVSIWIAGRLAALNSGESIFAGDWTVGTSAAFIVGFTLVADLSVYLVHRFHHHSKVFWPIHALHHSAEVLTPFTLFRKHPLWNLSADLVSKAMTGVFQGVFIFVFYGPPSFAFLFGLNTIYVLYNFFGSNLRHSHIWLSWGKPLSFVFISPAMHQVHHDPTRMDKNYGEIFALWDWLFGSLYIPAHREEFAIGLGPDLGNPHDSAAKAYYVPLVDMWKQIKRKFERASAD